MYYKRRIHAVLESLALHVGLPVTWQFVGNELIAFCFLLMTVVVVRKNLWLNDHLIS